MKLTADRKQLLDAAKAVSKFLPRKSFDGLPYAHILLECQGPSLRLTATNLEAGRSIDVPVDVAEAGKVLVSPDLVGVLAGATGDDVSLSATDKNLTVHSKLATWRLALYPVDDYPDMTARADAEPAKVDIAHWYRIQAISGIAQGVSGSRPILQGVFLEDGVAVATDSYRMAWAEFTDQKEHPATLIPSHAIQSLDGAVTALEVGDRMVRADTDDGSWWTRVIDGTYLKWKSLVDSFDKPALTVEADSAVLADAVKRATIVGIPDLPVYFEKSTSGLWVRRHYQGETVYEEEITADVTGDTDMKIAFQPSYLRSMVAPVGSVKIEMVDPHKMAQITGDWWQGALMPVRT